MSWKQCGMQISSMNPMNKISQIYIPSNESFSHAPFFLLQLMQYPRVARLKWYFSSRLFRTFRRSNAEHQDEKKKKPSRIGSIINGWKRVGQAGVVMRVSFLIKNLIRLLCVWWFRFSLTRGTKYAMCSTCKCNQSEIAFFFLQLGLSSVFQAKAIAKKWEKKTRSSNKTANSVKMKFCARAINSRTDRRKKKLVLWLINHGWICVGMYMFGVNVCSKNFNNVFIAKENAINVWYEKWCVFTVHCSSFTVYRPNERNLRTESWFEKSADD